VPAVSVTLFSVTLAPLPEISRPLPVVVSCPPCTEAPFPKRMDDALSAVSVPPVLIVTPLKVIESPLAASTRPPALFRPAPLGEMLIDPVVLLLRIRP